MKVGVILMLEGDAVLAPRYREVRALAMQAEADGFDSVWIYDHLLFRAPEEATKGQWECFTFLAALAEATARVELGTLVACTAFRNPAMLAKMAVTLDEVSSGRFTLGIGAGWNEAEFRAFGLPYDHRVDRFEEAIQIIAPLLREGRVDFAGRYAAAHDCEILPSGPRARVPLMVGASGPRMLRLAAQYADSLNTGYDIVDPARPHHHAIGAACAEVGRDPATLPVSVPFWATFPDLGETPPHMRDAVYRTPEEVAERLRAHDRAGLAHLMFDFRPNTPASLARLAEALRLYRDG